MDELPWQVGLTVAFTILMALSLKGTEAAVRDLLADWPHFIVGNFVGIAIGLFVFAANAASVLYLWEIV